MSQQMNGKRERKVLECSTYFLVTDTLTGVYRLTLSLYTLTRAVWIDYMTALVISVCYIVELKSLQKRRKENGRSTLLHCLRKLCLNLVLGQALPLSRRRSTTAAVRAREGRTTYNVASDRSCETSGYHLTRYRRWTESHC